MSAPFGHALVAAAIARRMGVRSPLGLAAAALAGNLPDFDIPISAVVHRDPWRFHRKEMHSLDFALVAGVLAGAAGIVAAESVEGERDLIADAMTGAVVVGSHIALDRVPYLPVRFGPKVLGLSVGGWLADTLLWAAVAWAIWPKKKDE